MSDNNEDSIAIGGQSFRLFQDNIKIHKRVDDPANKAKKKTVEEDYPVFAPVVNTNEDYIRLFTAILVEADKTEAGNGVKLGKAYFADRIREASDDAFNLETGDSDEAKYVKRLTEPEHSRSSGLTLASINGEMAELTPEFVLLSSVSRTRDGWKSLKATDDSPLFASEEEYVLRLASVGQTMGRLVRQREEKLKRSAATKQKRDEKLAQSKAAEALVAQQKATAVAA